MLSIYQWLAWYQVKQETTMHNELDYELVAVVAIVLLDIRLHILCNIHDSQGKYFVHVRVVSNEHLHSDPFVVSISSTVSVSIRFLSIQ